MNYDSETDGALELKYALGSSQTHFNNCQRYLFFLYSFLFVLTFLFFVLADKGREMSLKVGR